MDANRIFGDIRFPKMVKIERRFPDNRIADPGAYVEQKLVESGLTDDFKAGESAGVAVGSRGIKCLYPVVAAVVRHLKRARVKPVIIPAMGSHGGATPAGQKGILAAYGITGEALGVPINADMDTATLGSIPGGPDVFFAKSALSVDHLIVINRIKVHTDFHGETESGIGKMLVIGLGKREGAGSIHRFGVHGLRDMIPYARAMIIRQAPPIIGIGIVENAYDDPAHIEVFPGEEIPEREPHMLQMARKLMPRLPADEIDVLVVDRIGKDISGAGLDTNVIGRMMIHGEKEPESPSIKRIVVLDVTPASHGNAVGIGLADVTTRRLVDSIDFDALYTNALTATFIRRASIPVTMDTDREAIAAALGTCWLSDTSRARLVRIRDTLTLHTCWVSESLLPELQQREPQARVLAGPEMIRFDASGQIQG